MSADEASVTTAFVRHLAARGWDVHLDSADYTDVRAYRGAETLVAEVKGHTKSAGAAVDILYGQALRMMSRYPTAEAAVVVPESLLPHVTRVSAAVRRQLDLTVYLVDDFGQVRRLSAE